MSSWLLDNYATPVSYNTPEEVAAASRVIAARARDPEEARDLLRMVGILPPAPPAQIEEQDGRVRRWVDHTQPGITMAEVREWCLANGHPPRRGIYGALALAAYLTANPSQRPLPPGVAVWQCARCGTWWPHVRRVCLSEHPNERNG